MNHKKRIIFKKSNYDNNSNCNDNNSDCYDSCGIPAVLWLTTDPRGTTELKTKIRGYASQDQKKNHSTSLEVTDVLEKIVLARGSCQYCDCAVWLKDYPPRYKKQWTLDRIDNSKGHTIANTVISCLGCNLRRRRRPYKAFLDGERLVMRKVGV